MDSSDDIVISGVGGRFPECDNFEELEAKLYGKVNMVNNDRPRWSQDELHVTNSIGKIKDPDVFDYTFFGIYRKLCEVLENNVRLSLAATVEALSDAGINLKDLSGTNTGVIINSGLCETEYTSGTTGRHAIGQGLLGHCKNMEAGRISFFLNTKGPSLVVSANWNGGLVAMQRAADLIRTGEVEMAIVAAASAVIVRSEISYHYDKMGRLDENGITRSFSDDASGYARSEAVVVLVLQKACDAKRSYGSFLGAIHQSTFSIKSPLNMPNADLSQEYIKTLHEEVGIEPNEVGYIEGYGGASKKVDSIELNSYADYYLKESRSNPLLVGSVMSNLGHCEFASSFVSLAKVLIIMKNGRIPPNLNYGSPNSLVPALLNGQMKVVTEETPLEGNVIGLGSYGFTGDFGYALFRRNPKTKKDVEMKRPPVTIPRLVLLSGRTEGALQSVLTKVASMPVDDEFIALTNGLYKEKFHNYFYRGYVVLDGSENPRAMQEAPGDETKPIWFLFSGMGSQWSGMGKELLKIDIFERAIRKCDAVLKPKGLDIFNIIGTDDPNIFNNILHAFVGIGAVQIGLTDILKALGVLPDGIIGHSLGELGCAYADGSFTAEQMISAAYARGKASVEAGLIKGMMAAVGMGYKEIKDQLPPTIEVACRNSSTSCTLSGPAEDMAVFIDQLKAKKVFAKLVNVSNIAFHSQYIKPAAPALLKYLQKAVPEPKQRSLKWISTSVPEADWTTPLAKYSSAEYHTNNLLSPVLFEEASRHIPKKAIVIEIAPHGLMQSIVKKSLPGCTHIPLTNRFESDGVRFLLAAIGKLYNEGVNVNASCLYPNVEFPVSRETPYLHPLVTWDDSSRFPIEWDKTLAIFSKFSTNFQDLQVQTIDNYWITRTRSVHAQGIIPLAYFLSSVLEFYSSEIDSENRAVSLRNIRNEKDVCIKETLNMDFQIALLRVSGKFEVTDQSDERIVTGDVSHHVTDAKYPTEEFLSHEENELTIEKNEVYDFFRYYGYVVHESLHLIERLELSDNGVRAVVKWNDSMTDFLDSTFTVIAFYHTFKTNHFCGINFIRDVTIDYKYFNKETKEFYVSYDSITNVLTTRGLTIVNVETETTNDTNRNSSGVVTHQVFAPFTNTDFQSIGELLNAFKSIVQENMNSEGASKKDSRTLNIINLHRDPTIKTEIEKLVNFSSKLKIRVINDLTDGIRYLEKNPFGNDVVWLIVDESNVKDALNTLEDGNADFVLTDCEEDVKSRNCASVVEWNCQRRRFVLFKQVRKQNGELKTVHALTSHWMKDLAGALNETKHQIIHLIKPFQAIEEIYDTLKHIEVTGCSYRIRLLFVDNKTPSYAPTCSYFNEQLKKDLKVNVSFEGKWGTLVQTVVPGEKEDNLTGPNQFSLSAIECPNVKIMSIGVNSEDITGNTPVSFGLIEYSGIADGEPVVGLAVLDKSNELKLDKHFQWRKPKHWSHHEASSSLLPYTIASHVLGIIEENENVDKVALVHRGALPVCQAIINLLIAASWKIITTYKTDEERNKLKSTYPKFLDHQILSSRDHSFYATVRLAHPNGIGIVINTLKESELLNYSIKCLQRNGLFIYLNGGASKEKSKMGMYPFFKEVKMTGVSSQEILGLREIVKQSIRNKVSEIISCGNTKPFHFEEISSSLFNSEVLSILRQRKPMDNKLVLNMNKPREKNKNFDFDEAKAFVVLGETTDQTLNLIDYVVSRKGVHIYVCLNGSFLSKFAKKRIFSTTRKQPNVEIELIDRDCLNSISNVIRIIKSIRNSHEIGGVLMMGMDLMNAAASFDSALKENNVSTNFISIGSGGELTHHSRYKRREASICVRCNLDRLYSGNSALNFDRFMSLPQTSAVYELSEISQIEKTDNLTSIDSSYLPQELDELMLFKSTRTSVPRFIELESGCPSYEFAKEIDPLFFISGFRPVLVREFAKQLFYPTFEAILPAEFGSLESVAGSLSCEIEKFDLNAITLLADTCGGELAFLVATNLESKGKLVSLILLDAAPDNARKWLEDDVKTSEDEMIKQYSKQLKNEASQISLSVRDVTDAVRIIRNHQNAILQAPRGGKTFSGQCIYVKLGHQESINTYEDVLRLQEACSRSLRVEQTEETSLQRLLANPNVVSYVNKMVLNDFKDSARPLTFDDMEMY